MKMLSPALIVARSAPGWLNERVELHDLKPVLYWLALIILIYLHCTRGTVLEAESRPGTPYRSYPDRRRLLQPSPRFGRGEEGPLHFSSQFGRIERGLLFHPEWAWFWTTLGEDQWL